MMIFIGTTSGSWSQDSWTTVSVHDWRVEGNRDGFLEEVFSPVSIQSSVKPTKVTNPRSKQQLANKRKIAKRDQRPWR